MEFHRYGPLMSENEGARLKIGPLICIPPEDRYNNTQQLRIKALEEKTQLNENTLADQATTIAENQETFRTFGSTVATKTDLENIEVSRVRIVWPKEDEGKEFRFFLF